MLGLACQLNTCLRWMRRITYRFCFLFKDRPAKPDRYFDSKIFGSDQQSAHDVGQFAAPHFSATAAQVSTKDSKIDDLGSPEYCKRALTSAKAKARDHITCRQAADMDFPNKDTDSGWNWESPQICLCCNGDKFVLENPAIFEHFCFRTWIDKKFRAPDHPVTAQVPVNWNLQGILHHSFTDDTSQASAAESVRKSLSL